MSRRDGANQFEFHPPKAFTRPDNELIQGCLKRRWFLIAWAGVERCGLEFPASQTGRRCGHFEFSDNIVQFPTIKTVNRLRNKVSSLRHAAGHGDAITALGTFEQVSPPHAPSLPGVSDIGNCIA